MVLYIIYWFQGNMYLEANKSKIQIIANMKYNIHIIYNILNILYIVIIVEVYYQDYNELFQTCRDKFVFG